MAHHTCAKLNSGRDLCQVKIAPGQVLIAAHFEFHAPSIVTVFLQRPIFFSNRESHEHSLTAQLLISRYSNFVLSSAFSALDEFY